jgi:cyclic pyranopterin phosphate synthase
MSVEDIGKIVRLATEFGVQKIKLTGGEPLLRKDIVDVVKAVNDAGVKEISMTTNGVLLAGLARELAKAGLTRVNISLDTLDPKTFSKITGNGSLQKVMAGMEAAIDAGLDPVKLNMVMLAGLNEGEVEKIMTYASEHGAVLQLIELLDTNGGDFKRYHRGLQDIEKELSARATSIQTRRSMHARKKYILPNGEVEVVRPMHNTEFCSHCTRLRLTADGRLKPCLMRNDNLVDLLTHIRTGDIKGARNAFTEAIARREPYFKIAAGKGCVHARA